MTWDAKTLRALSDLTHTKYDAQFRGRLEEWKGYLSSVGIERSGRPPRSGGPRRVFIECPWSVDNSTPGILSSKSNLFFPEELAEKIVVLGVMP